MKNSVPLDEIKAFVDVAEAGSFNGAAARLNVAHSSLSRKVNFLEQWLGERLFQRTPSGVVLTAAGARHLQHFGNALELIRGSIGTASRYGSLRPVQISAVPGVCMALLLPHHTELCESIDGLAIRYNLERRLTDFSDGSELAVRSGGGSWHGAKSALILESWVQPFANRRLATMLGPDPEPARLLDYPLVHLAVETAWRNWFSRRGVNYALRDIDHVIGDVTVSNHAVHHGLGIGLHRRGIDPEPAPDKVRLVGQASMVPDFGYFLVRPLDKPLRPIAQRYARGLMQRLGCTTAEIERFLG
ncbi:MAG: LysR family transcriptional regulator [Methylobacterium sp.]|nr:LysR family transcriptional regulator [Methylobacterium sp.]MCA3657397.1 LysR family transcriptional regulator [Methylobacterium sp.]MCA3659847.1 LysR family transcriptional regulator [Methylobacterium sp.]MCA3662279.1 LysR family transcriptional regulator [Methylobacterium sp.]MCA3667386.1 LysR family transcriptional regulator [Methylobacterium sp.]